MFQFPTLPWMIAKLQTVTSGLGTPTGLLFGTTYLAVLPGLDETWRTEPKEVYKDPAETQYSAEQVDTSKDIGMEEVELGK